MYELVFHSGQRVLLRGPLFEPWRRFLASIGEVAPGIRFEHRHLGFCHRCGRAVSSIQRRCAHCGATAPTTLPTLEADVMLPDALRGGDADD